MLDVADEWELVDDRVMGWGRGILGGMDIDKERLCCFLEGLRGGILFFEEDANDDDASVVLLVFAVELTAWDDKFKAAVAASASDPKPVEVDVRPNS